MGALASAPGRKGEAGQFAGEAYLRVDDPEMFNLEHVTVAAWINPDAVDGRHGLVAKRLAGTAAPFVVSLWDGAIEFEATDTEGSWSHNFRSPVAVLAGQWSHVAVVVENRKSVIIYVNGQEIARKENPLGRVTNSEPLIIGREAWAGVNMVHEPCFFQGLIEEVKVWGRALTADEVAQEAGG
jgi:hypothetical protein